MEVAQVIIRLISTKYIVSADEFAVFLAFSLYVIPQLDHGMMSKKNRKFICGDYITQ